MSRPMALALVLLVLFLTSQSDWRASMNSPQLTPEATPLTMSREMRLKTHRDGVKDKVILDLIADVKFLEAENRRLREERFQMEKQIRKLQLTMTSSGCTGTSAEALLVEDSHLPASISRGGGRSEVLPDNYPGSDQRSHSLLSRGKPSDATALKGHASRESAPSLGAQTRGTLLLGRQAVIEQGPAELQATQDAQSHDWTKRLSTPRGNAGGSAQFASPANSEQSTSFPVNQGKVDQPITSSTDIHQMEKAVPSHPIQQNDKALSETPLERLFRGRSGSLGTNRDLDSLPLLAARLKKGSNAFSKGDVQLEEQQP